MRRNLLHVAFALVTYTAGLYISATDKSLTGALIIGLIIFVLLKSCSRLNLNSHYLKVTLLTLLIWIPIAALMIHVALPPGGTCEIYIADETKPFVDETLPPRGMSSETIANPCGCGQSFTEAELEEGGRAPEAPLNGGVLNGKAISLHHPIYPHLARAARASGTVVVQVLIDKRGCIQSAHALSGHPLLQAASVRAARLSCFYPTLLAGYPVKVKGIITYNFIHDDTPIR